MGLFDNLAGALGQGAGAAIGDLLKDQGLEGVIAGFDKAGLGDIAGSWVSQGANLPVSPDQISAVLGSGPVAKIAERLGVDPDQAADVIAKALPQVIDRLTPDGKAPSAGLGGLGDLLGGLKL